MIIKFIFILLLIQIAKTAVDECLYSIQRKHECFKIPKNDLDENCCYLEMELNKIFTTACIRVKNNAGDINKKIFNVKNEEDVYKLENIKIECFSNNLLFNIYTIFVLYLLLNH